MEAAEWRHDGGMRLNKPNDDMMTALTMVRAFLFLTDPWLIQLAPSRISFHQIKLSPSDC
jgi:hypothetical protein